MPQNEKVPMMKKDLEGYTFEKPELFRKIQG